MGHDYFSVLKVSDCMDLWPSSRVLGLTTGSEVQIFLVDGKFWNRFIVIILLTLCMMKKAGL